MPSNVSANRLLGCVRRLVCILCCSSGMWLGAAYAPLSAQDIGTIAAIYQIRQLPMQAQNSDLVQAKAQALQVAKQIAFRQVLLRVTGEEDIAIPLSSELERMIRSVQINQEIFGGQIYRARLNIEFVPNAVRRYLRRLNVRFVEAQAEAVLIVPITRFEGLDYLWSSENYWWPAWKHSIDPDSAVHNAANDDVAIAASMGSGKQVVPLRLPEFTDTRLHVSDFTAPYPGFLRLRQAYQVPEIYAIHQYLPTGLDIKNLSFSLKNSTLNDFKDVSAPANSADTIPIKVVLQRVSPLEDLSWKREKVFDIAPTESQKIIDWAQVQINKHWLGILLAEAGQDDTIKPLHITVPDISLVDWIAVKQTFDTISTLRYVVPTYMRPNYVELDVDIYGALSVFVRQLAATGWQLLPEAKPITIGQTTVADRGNADRVVRQRFILRKMQVES